MTKIEYKVCVVTVTYGDRWKFLEQVLKRVLSWPSLSHLVIVNNASRYSVDEKIAAFSDARIRVLNETENLGSAGGYKRGIEEAEKLGDEFVFLLDDDNVPSEESLGLLFQAWGHIPGDDSQKALFCFREDRIQHVKIAKGEDPARFYLTTDNFLGFNVFRIFYNQYKKLNDKILAKKGLKDRVRLPYVPYGGLFFHKAMISRIGYPDERFYLYVDDSEYSYRITKSGGSIWLIPSANIVDVDKSQGIGYKGSLFKSVLLDQWSFRTYYHVRNMIYFNTREAVKNKFIFNINKRLYLAGLWLISLINSKQGEFKQLLAAVEDGLNGKLGRKDFQNNNERN